MTKNKSKKEIEQDDIVDDVVFEEVENTESSFSDSPTKKIREKLKKCVEEKQEYLNGWQRSKADMVNSRKDLEDQKKDFVKYAKADLINQILPVIDSFDMAFANTDNVPEGWLAGVKHIYNQMLTVLSDNDVIQIDPLGETLDLKKHIAVESVKIKDEKQDGKIVEVVQKGYKMHDKIIREARVKVGELL
jgi:molecular chaperone GrpE